VLLRQYVDQGLSKTAIADRLGLTRRTIQRWIAAAELDRDLTPRRCGIGPGRRWSGSWIRSSPSSPPG